MIFFDLETTGLPKAEGSDLDMQPKIIEFGAIKLDEDLVESDRIEFLCNPGYPLEPIITKITGIICTVEIGEGVWGKKRKLGDIYEEITGEKIDGAHRSTVDIEAMIEIFKWYRKEGHA